MKTTFRQGVIRHSTSPLFLQTNGSYVTLQASASQPTIVTFANRTKNYLFTEAIPVSNAWGPFSSGTDYWLFWELNRASGLRSFGFTRYEPILSSATPSSPAIGQMWWNPSLGYWRMWQGSMWVEKIRVLAAKYASASTFESVSINAPLYTGTQVGLTASARAGSLVFDTSQRPIFDNDNQFFTTEDYILTGVPSGASLRIESMLLTAEAQQPLSAYQVVMFNQFNSIISASPFTTVNKVYGIIQEDVTTNNTVNVITEGLIYNEQWNWQSAGGSVNSPVYVGNGGEVRLTRAITKQLPVGVVIGPQSILFRPGTFG